MPTTAKIVRHGSRQQQETVHAQSAQLINTVELKTHAKIVVLENTEKWISKESAKHVGLEWSENKIAPMVV